MVNRNLAEEKELARQLGDVAGFKPGENDPAFLQDEESSNRLDTTTNELTSESDEEIGDGKTTQSANKSS